MAPLPPPVDSNLSAKPTKLSTKCEACHAGPDKISRDMIEALNNRDYDHPVLSHMSTHCHTEHEYIISRSKLELMKTYGEITTLFPEYHIKVTNSTGEVDEVNGKAKIWLSLEVTGYPRNVRREGISLLYWRVSRGEWSHYRNRGLTHGGRGD